MPEKLGDLQHKSEKKKGTGIGNRKSWKRHKLNGFRYINFLFDKSQTPHMTGDELCELFGVKKSSVAGKAKLIRDTLRIDYFNPRWNLSSKLLHNPTVWMLELNGFIIDMRDAPRKLQEEAYDLGLIPYIPGGNQRNQ